MFLLDIISSLCNLFFNSTKLLDFKDGKKFSKSYRNKKHTSTTININTLALKESLIFCEAILEILNHEEIVYSPSSTVDFINVPFFESLV